MNGRERVLCSISHGRPDRTPTGDLALDAKLERELAKMGGCDGDNPNELRLAALRLLELLKDQSQPKQASCLHPFELGCLP